MITKILKRKNKEKIFIPKTDLTPRKFIIKSNLDLFKPYAKTCTNFKEEKTYLNKHEIKHLEKINNRGIIIEIYANNLKYKKPKESIETCIAKKKNYEINSYILINMKSNGKTLIK